MTFPILGGNGAVAGAFSIDNSLRFEDGDSSNLTKDFSSEGDRRTWTWSAWLKRSNLTGAERIIFDSRQGGNANPSCGIAFTANETLDIINYSGGINFRLTTNQVFRDTSAWFHILFRIDTTDSTADDRVQLYVNGEQVTSFSSRTNPSQNYQGAINDNARHAVGSISYGGYHFDGYMAEVHFIDGTAKAPTDFGEFDEDSGIWKPISYTGNYGTNGFKLDFSNSGSLGADSSGNGNDFTATNLASTDQTTDTPTNNFSTFNSLITKSGTLSEGNLKSTGDGSGPSDNSISTMGVNTGKWYAEFELTADGEISGTTNAGFGICDEQSDFFDVGNNFQTSTSNAIGLKDNSNMYRYGTENASWGSSFTENDILQIALDMDNGYVYFGKNGTFMNSGVPTSGSSGTGGISITNTDRKYFMFVGESYFYATPIWSSNFGNPSFSITSGNSDDNGYGNFEYAPPSGYLALCTQNLATELSPTIDDGSEYFNTILYSGTGSTQSMTGVGFQPDFVWLKSRSNTHYHNLYDSVRGATRAMFSNFDGAEVIEAGNLQSFTSDGFTADGFNGTNGSSRTYVAWNWKANAGTTSSNTSGSITSTVQANTTAGFSIVTYTGNGGGQTIGHGLSQAPVLSIRKKRNTTGDWFVHTNIFDGGMDYLKLNTTDAKSSSSLANFTATTSGADDNSDQYVVYFFHSVEGYSKIGTYTGNGSTDGTFVHTGFKPAFVMIKRTDASGDNWVICDNKRDTFNVMENILLPNDNSAEFDETSFDFVSNGFKLRQSAGTYNASGGTIIYMAFAENPFVSSSGVPVTAR
jgi:hypothetical protein